MESSYEWQETPKRGGIVPGLKNSGKLQHRFWCVSKIHYRAVVYKYLILSKFLTQMYEMPEKHEESRDDLIFFVMIKGQRDGDDSKQVQVRRKTKEFPVEFQGSTGESVDWKETLILNLVMQTNYEFAALRDSLSNLDSNVGAMLKDTRAHKDSDDSQASGPDGPLCIQKKVYPVLSCHEFVRESKQNSMHHSYPDIYFELLDTFSGIDISSDTSANCFAISLMANMNSSWSTDKSKRIIPRLLLFSGYVTFEQLQVALEKESNSSSPLLSAFKKLSLLSKIESSISRDAKGVTYRDSDLILRGENDSGIACVSFVRHDFTHGQQETCYMQHLHCDLKYLKMNVNTLAKMIATSIVTNK